MFFDIKFYLTSPKNIFELVSVSLFTSLYLNLIEFEILFNLSCEFLPIKTINLWGLVTFSRENCNITLNLRKARAVT